MTDYKIKERLESMIDEHIKRLSTILINNNEKNIYKYKAELEILKFDNTNNVNEIVRLLSLPQNNSLSTNLQNKQKELLQIEELYQAMINQIAKYTTAKLHDSFGGNQDEIKINEIINKIKLLYNKRKGKRSKYQDNDFENLVNYHLDFESNYSILNLVKLTNKLNDKITNNNWCRKHNIKRNNNFYCDIKTYLEELLNKLQEVINIKDINRYNNFDFTLETVKDIEINKHKIITYFDDIEDIKNKIIKITNKIVYGKMPDRIDEEILNDLYKILSFDVKNNFIEDFSELIINYISQSEKYCKKITEHEKYTPFCDITILLKELIKILKKDSPEAFKYDDNNLYEVKHKIKEDYHNKIKDKIVELKGIAWSKFCSTEISNKFVENFWDFDLNEGFIEDLVESTKELISMSKEMCEQTKDYCNSKSDKEFQYKYIYKTYCDMNKSLKELIKILEEAYEGEEYSQTIEYYHTLDEDIYIENAEKEKEIYKVKTQIRDLLKSIKENYDKIISDSRKSAKTFVHISDDKIKGVLDFVLKKSNFIKLKPLIDELILHAEEILTDNKDYNHGSEIEINNIISNSFQILKLIDSISHEYTGYDISSRPDRAPKIKDSYNANLKKKIKYFYQAIDKVSEKLPHSTAFFTFSYEKIILLIANSKKSIENLKKRNIPDLKRIIQDINEEAIRIFYITFINSYDIIKAINAIMVSSRIILDLIDNEGGYIFPEFLITEKIDQCLKLINEYYPKTFIAKSWLNPVTNNILLEKGIDKVMNFNVLDKNHQTSSTLTKLKKIIKDFIDDTKSVCQNNDNEHCDPTRSIILYSRHIEKLIDCKSNDSNYKIFFSDLYYLYNENFKEFP